MSLRLWHTIALLLCGVGLSICGQEKPGKQAETAKQPALATTPPSAAPAQKNGLKQMEEDLFKPLKTFSPNSSLDGVFTAPRPVPQRAPEDKKTREKREREKEWIFMNPEDFMTSPTLEEIFNVSSKENATKDQKKLSPYERYLGRSFRVEDDKDSNDPTALKSRQDSRNRPGLPGDKDAEDDSRLSPSLRATKRSLDSISDRDRVKGKPVSNSDFLTDIFGLGKNVPTFAETEAKKMQKARMDEFKQLLGMPVTPGPGDSLNPLRGLYDSPSPALSSVGVSGGSTSPATSPFAKPGAVSPQLGTIGGFSSGFGQPSSGGLPSPFAPPIATEPAKPRIPQPNPGFTAPRRVF